MTFDPVHDSQAVHRALVKAFSFPGIPVSIEGPGSRCRDPRLPGALGAVVRTLLDPETTFHHPNPGVVIEVTGARLRPLDQASFVLAPWWDEQLWIAAWTGARRGTLVDPHEGATVIGWAPENTLGTEWIASGPGIERPFSVGLPGAGLWVEARNQACGEFPVGVDGLWIRGSEVIAVPRTTRLVRKEG